MEKIKTIEEGVARLFVEADIPAKPFKYVPRGKDAYCDAVEINGKLIPMYDWRYYVKNNGLYQNCDNHLGKLSTLRTSHFAGRDKTLRQLLFIELDLAEFFLRSKVAYIMGFGTEKAANFIVKMENDTICSLELAVTMPAGEKARAKHTIYSTNGQTSDLCFDNKLDQDEIFLFADGGNQSFVDIDVPLFGLSLKEMDLTYTIFGLLRDLEDHDEWIAREGYLLNLVDGAMKSLETGEKTTYKELRV